MKKKETKPEKQVKPQNIISESIKMSDIRDIANYNSILFKLMSGIIMISNTYAKLISTVFPMLKIIDPSKENSNIIRKRFFNILKSYMRSSTMLDQDKQSLLTERYSLIIHNEIGEEGMSILSLEYLNAAYKRFIDDIRIMVLESDINLWSNKFTVIEEDLRSIYNEIISFEQDIQNVYIDDVIDVFNTNELEENKNKVSIKSFADISNYAIETLSCLDDTFLIINEIIYSMGFCIDIKDPTHAYDSVDKLYQVYYNMNSDDDDLLKSSLAEEEFNEGIYELLKSENNKLN